MFSIIYHCSYEECKEENEFKRKELPNLNSFENSKNNSNLLKSLEKFFKKDSEYITIILSIILLFSFTILNILFSFSTSLLLGIILDLIIFLSVFYTNNEEIIDSIYNNRKILFIALLVLNLLRIISSLSFVVGLILSVIFCLSISSSEKVENFDNVQIHP